MVAPMEGHESKLMGMTASAKYLGISRSQIYVLEESDPDFPARFPVGSRRYLTTKLLKEYIQKKRDSLQHSTI